MVSTIFSTRETAAIIWFILFCIYILTQGEIRESAWQIVVSIGHRYIICSLLSLFLYISFITYFPLYVSGFWEINMIKDTCIWGVFTASSILLNIHKAKDFTYFKRIITDNIKLIMIIEFLLNLYTFSLVIELIIFPILILLVMMHSYETTYHQGKSEYKKIISCINRISALIGWGILIYVIWITITKFHDLLSISNLKILLLPVFLTILSVPYFYVVALLIGYNNIFSAINYVQRDNPLIAKKMIKATKKYANVHLKRLSRISQYYALFDPAKDNAADYIKRISRGPRHQIGSKAKLFIFNDIVKVMKILSQNGIGEFGAWLNVGSEEYSAATNYFLLNNDNLLCMPNNLMYSITGGKDYIYKLELTLKINSQQYKDKAIAKFKDIVLLTCKRIQINCPQDLIDAIDHSFEYHLNNDTYSLELISELLGKTEIKVFAIISQL